MMRCIAFVALVFFFVLALYVSQESSGRDKLRTRLLAARDELEHRVYGNAKTRGSVTWSVFNENQSLHSGKRVILTNADFSEGTLIVTHACLLDLQEDVVFGPNPHHGFTVRRPEQSDTYKHESGFSVGFFAAISIEARSGVVLEGNGHTFSQHPSHAMLQRFYAHIELANSPFVVGEGPVPFAPLFRPAKNVLIKNVRFGRSAHFGVSGNGNENIFLQHLTFADYEIAAFKLNGVHGALVQDVRALGHFTNVPVNAEFSQTTFLLDMLKRAPHRPPELDSAIHRIQALHVQARADIESLGRISKTLHEEAYNLFASDSGIQTGGTTYGFVITDLGSAVGPIQMDHSEKGSSRDVFIERVSVTGTRSHTVEFVTLVDHKGQFIHGPIGGLLNIDRIFKQYGSITKDPLANLMFEFARYYETLSPTSRHGLGRPNIPIPLLMWVERTGGPLDASFGRMMKENGMRVSTNSDGMGHVNKGLMVCRIQSSDNVYLVDVDLGDAFATGPPPYRGSDVWMPVGTSINPVTYNGKDHRGGHPLQHPMYGYHGNDIHGLAIASSYDVSYEGISTGHLNSINGRAVKLEEFPVNE